MLTYIARRLLTLIPMVIVISFLIYLGLELTPGDAVSHMVPPDALSMMDEERLQALRESLGLGKPFIVRYWIWITGVMQGEFGYSLAGGVPISKIFLDRLPATLELSFAALLISTVLGSILGTISALTRGSLTDQSLTVVGMLGVSIPEFFFGLVAILVFALNLNWFPVGGRILPGYDSFWDRLPHLVMPAMVLSIMMTA
ncbi:ABC transporter permease, partial [Alexandriicola marinus]|uniref:ABC transporter permease n=1 Tax=Alexandriicola marinus TaxID=2081710 RepID=UPI0013DF1656